MSREKIPSTPAVRLLHQHKVDFSPHLYAYEVKGGTAVSARELEVDEHAVIKTLIFEDDLGRPMMVLMHGDRQVSAKALARTIGVKSVAPCVPAVADRHSGYQVGGTSPFATRKAMPVFMEETILDLPKIYINGGKRGFLVGLDPREAVRLLKPTLVSVAI
jgi:Cys-tRNA(Pro) deacylase